MPHKIGVDIALLVCLRSLVEAEWSCAHKRRFMTVPSAPRRVALVGTSPLGRAALFLGSKPVRLSHANPD